MIVMNDESTKNVSKPYLVLSITILNMMPQFAVSLTYNSRVVIYDFNMSIIQATGYPSG
jgi:hypothetical protein